MFLEISNFLRFKKFKNEKKGKVPFHPKIRF
jgi:hypothetical protein